ncbi:YIP1 family protein [Aliigemmobacter aestuarii]|uniref:YIP1 family protein n=1 Tax=Aliigemmobacter aestuarii TaxID=1445661 RepID=A0A4S3MLD9_9RHOB|nr:YIP1 family protein [Gemmobacter aestuarii]THD83028.1 YIP1 family protein [Gemmobacter aestuarii]
MQHDMTPWVDLARLSLRDPRAGGEALLRTGIPAQTGWTVLVLTAVLSTVVTHALYLVWPEFGTGMGAFHLPPIALAVLQLVSGVVTVVLVHVVGRMFGGRGELAGAVLIVAWMQVILMALQIAQAVLYLVLPPFGQILGLVSMMLLFWLMTGFIAALHGFRSLGMVFAGMIAAAIGLVLVLSALLALLGVPQMMMEA